MQIWLQLRKKKKRLKIIFNVLATCNDYCKLYDSYLWTYKYDLQFNLK